MWGVPRENLDRNCEDQPRTDVFISCTAANEQRLSVIGQCYGSGAVLRPHSRRNRQCSRRDEAAVGRGYFPLFSHVRTCKPIFSLSRGWTWLIVLMQCFSSGTDAGHTPFKPRISQYWPKITTYNHVHWIFLNFWPWFRRGWLCDWGLSRGAGKHTASWEIMLPLRFKCGPLNLHLEEYSPDPWTLIQMNIGTALHVHKLNEGSGLKLRLGLNKLPVCVWAAWSVSGVNRVVLLRQRKHKQSSEVW